MDEENDYKVTGNGCPRGAIYGKKECTHPTRVVTSTVKIVGAEIERLSEICEKNRKIGWESDQAEKLLLATQFLK